jgi:hypothetical protein
MRFLVLALTGCTLGGTARVEGSLDLGGRATYRASVDPGFGATGLADANDVCHTRALIVLFTFGGGWGSDGPFFATGLEGATVPAPGGGFGYSFGLRTRMDRKCVRWSFGYGVSRLVAQIGAEQRSDSFGPNPQLTRAFHTASGFAGFASCDGDSSFHAMLGAAYEVGIAELLFAPGP